MTTHTCVHMHVCAADFPWGAYVSGPQLGLHSFSRVTHTDNGGKYKLRSPNTTQDSLLWRDISLAETRGNLALQSETLEQWVDEFEEILLMVETGQMPLAPVTPLTPSQVQTLLDWQSGGFQP